MLVAIRVVVEEQGMGVLCFGKIKGLNYLRWITLNLALSVYVIMLLSSMFLRQLSGDDPRKLVIGNIHVLFNPKRGDIKLGQVHRLLSKANVLSEKWDRIPVILAGDFNSIPKSAIYNYLSTSKLNINSSGQRNSFWQNMCQFSLTDSPSLANYSSEEELTDGHDSSCYSQITHQLQLRSSYARIQSNARTRDSLGEPLATSYHSKFLGTVDYIWYSSGLACTRVLDTLPLDMLRKLGGLPCKDIGSDHLALVAEFIFTEGKETKRNNSEEGT
ncbi:carbon catabolite repressor protein [Canna indica]|uniref:Carbon catabolite repressor protein n=1 Tax=Canna indica TaxID=4628 RepID=A0AAQ3KHY7_9LILI|nr:carbon catabolite repressor protein [Canna indica]